MQRSQHDNPHEGDYHKARRNFRHQGARERSHEPDVWLVFNSLISEVDPEKLKGVNITKEAAMTIRQCSHAMKSVPQILTPLLSKLLQMM